ncbi:MAG TPA: SRPBCC family protein [Steroidobacteraceae bacterium]|nr:SRPBCC family protein [Steroidobacteraceae bacterium]
MDAVPLRWMALNGAAVALVAVALLAGARAQAASIETLSTSRHEDHYQVALHAHLDVPAPAAYAVFADVSNWQRLTPDLRRLEVLARHPGMVELSTGFRVCVLWFCRLVQGVPDVSFTTGADGGDVEVVFRPNTGDFRSGAAHWRFRASGSGTDLQFSAEAEPAFYVPPLIGPWLMSRWLRAQAVGTSTNIEALARR